MVGQVIGFQRGPVGHLAFTREHARTVTYIIEVTAAAVNADRGERERIRTVGDARGEEHGTIAVDLERRQIDVHIHGHVCAVAVHRHIADRNAVDFLGLKRGADAPQKHCQQDYCPFH